MRVQLDFVRYVAASFNIFAVRRAFAYGHSLLCSAEQRHASEGGAGGTPLGALVANFDAREAGKT